MFSINRFISDYYWSWLLLPFLILTNMSQSFGRLHGQSDYSPNDQPIVHLETGLILGKVEKILNQSVTSYLGIPYAEPPTGDLRFRKPRPIRTKSSGIYNATYFRSACSQKYGDEAIENLGGVDFSEDCLHLNIWTPQSTGHHGHNIKLKPVLFYIFASAFHKASPARPTHRGEYLSAIGEVIVVTPNYRLGFLGFACCGENYNDQQANDNMPGNLGLHDILLALKWTGDNIKRFGGDPEAITLSGSSAGAILSMSLILGSSAAPSSLIKNVFIMSGTPANQVTIDSVNDAIAKTRFITQQVSCSSIDISKYKENSFSSNLPPLTMEEIECLRNQANLTEILQLQDSEQVISIGGSIKNGIIPVYGDTLISTSPELMLLASDGSFSSPLSSTINHNNRRSFVIGNVQHEGSWKSDYWPSNKTEALQFLLPKLRSMLKTDNLNVLRQLNSTIDRYFRSVDENNWFAVERAMDQLYSDWAFKCPSLHYAEQLAIRRNLIHLYMFNYVPRGYSRPERNERPFGATHGDDTKLFFGDPFRDSFNYDDHDRVISRKLMEMYANFFKNHRLPWPPILTDRHGGVEPLRWRITGQLDKKDIDVVHVTDHCKQLNKLRNHKLYERRVFAQDDNNLVDMD